MLSNPFNYKTLVKRCSQIGDIFYFLSVLDELDIDDGFSDKKITSMIKQYESRGFSLQSPSYDQGVIKTPSGWHFNLFGIKNLINSRLRLGDGFQYEAFQAYNYFRLKGLQEILNFGM